MSQDPPSLDAGLASFSSLGLKVGRTTGAVVGRRVQLEAVERELAAAQQGLVCVALEGEPGIGKTRFLLAVEELARIGGFAAVAVTADEEIRGPFLVARSLFAAPAMLEAAQRTGTESQLRRVLDVLFDQDDPGLESLTSDRKLLRIFDLAAVAARTLGTGQNLAFAPQVRIGLHAADATQVGPDFMGKGVHEAARIAALAAGGEILASRETVAGTRHHASTPRPVSLKGIAEPVEVVAVEWR